MIAQLSIGVWGRAGGLCGRSQEGVRKDRHSALSPGYNVMTVDRTSMLTYDYA
jgi:hypothetical protein